MRFSFVLNVRCMLLKKNPTYIVLVWEPESENDPSDNIIGQTKIW